MATFLKPLLLFTLGLLLALAPNLPSQSSAAPDRCPIAASQPNPLAATLDQQGHQAYAQGQPQMALDCWQQAGKLYTQSGDQTGLAISQLNQTQALQSLGFYFQAKDLLVKLNASPPVKADAHLQTRGLRSLGDVLRSLGELTPPTSTPNSTNSSIAALTESLQLAKAQGLVAEEIATLISLGNTQRAIAKQARDRRESRTYAVATDCKQYQGESEQKLANVALTSYTAAADRAKAAFPTSYLQAQLNRLSLMRELGQGADPDSQVVLAEIKTQLQQRPGDRATVYAQLNLAQTLSCIKSTPAAGISQLLTQTLQQATLLNDPRAKSYALGDLGHLAETAGPGQRALALRQTQDALLLAQAISAPEIAYRWQWQLGRILAQSIDSAQPPQVLNRSTGNSAYTAAIAAYQEAVKTLKPVRSDLLSANTDVQFSFRDDVEPVYRELMELLLNRPGAAMIQQDYLKQAIQYIDELQLAELENFFRCNLLPASTPQVDKTPDPTAAIFYMVFLRDRVDVLLQLPGQPNLIHYPATIDRRTLEAHLDRFRDQLSRKSSAIDAVNAIAQSIYDGLLKPAEAALVSAQIKTLVFALDGNLRDIPMAALYDGKRYLIENYAVAVTPGLDLLGSQKTHSGLSGALLAGLTTANTIDIEGDKIDFAGLPNVETEIRQIAELFPTSQVLLNEQFTTEQFRAAVADSIHPVVHIATHGQFSSNPKETFLLTASQQPVDLNALQFLLRRRNQTQSHPIELLVFSACQTATGDRRATLGLAGIALRAGAFGTLASLWPVDDQATATLMVEFYRALSHRNAPVSKAEALRQAQLSFLHSNSVQRPTPIRGRKVMVADPDFKVPSTKNHPRYWAPFVLVGNWL